MKKHDHLNEWISTLSQTSLLYGHCFHFIFLTIYKLPSNFCPLSITQSHAHRVPPSRDQVLPAVALSHLQVAPAVQAAGGRGPWDPRHPSIAKG